MAQIHPYLNFNGNTEEVFNFYRSVFGGEFSALMRFSDNPESCAGLPEAEQNGIMHIALPIGRETKIMGTDVPSVMPPAMAGTNISISIDAESYEEATSLFNGLSNNGDVKLPLQKMDWGDIFGMLTDQYGIQWMISFNEAKQK